MINLKWRLSWDAIERRATALTALATIALAGLGIAQWAAVRAQIAEMRAEQRPWLTVDLAEQPSAGLDTNGLRITVVLKIENVGHLPAEGVTINPVAWPSGPHVPAESDAMHRAACVDPTAFGSTIFPGQEAASLPTYSFYITASELRHYWLSHSHIEPGVAPFSVVCVGYRDPDGTAHHTPIAFGLEAIRPGQPGVYGLEAVAAELSKAHIIADRALDYQMNPD